LAGSGKIMKNILEKIKEDNIRIGRPILEKIQKMNLQTGTPVELTLEWENNKTYKALGYFGEITKLYELTYWIGKGRENAFYMSPHLYPGEKQNINLKDVKDIKIFNYQI
jgi:hypothetical protein